MLGFGHSRPTLPLATWTIQERFGEFKPHLVTRYDPLEAFTVNLPQKLRKFKP